MKDGLFVADKHLFHAQILLKNGICPIFVSEENFPPETQENFITVCAATGRRNGG